MPNTTAIPMDVTVDLESTDATVLVVDDDEDLADTYALWLREYVDVHTAYDGSDALDVIESTDVDVVLLDRRMPSMSGDAVLAEMRSRGYEHRVSMVTAVEPSLDVVEMGFDDYLVKPVGHDPLVSTVEKLIALDEHADAFQEYFSLQSKLAVLQSGPEYRNEEAPAELEELRERVASQRDAALESLGHVRHDGGVDGMDGLTDTG